MRTIQDIHERLREIHDYAVETEERVQEISDRINELDENCRYEESVEWYQARDDYRADAYENLVAMTKRAYEEISK